MSWNTLADLTTGQIVTETHMDEIRENIEYLHSPNKDLVEHNEGSDYTTTSTSFVDVDATDLSQTLTTTGGNVLVLCQVVVLSGTAANTYFDVDIDGTRFGTANTLGLATWKVNDANDFGSITLAFIVDGLSAASHTFKLQWRVSAGTTTMYSTTANYPVIFHVIEL